MVRAESKGLLQIQATVMAIWKSRNSATFRGRPENLQRILFVIKQQSADLELKMNPKNFAHVKKKWEKPQSSWAKLNVDGSCRTSTNSGSIGGILGDAEGNWIWGFPTIYQAELRSLLRGLEIAWEFRTPKLIIETDSSNIFDCITEKSNPPADNLEDEVRKCKQLLRMPWDADFRKIDRSANSCADHLTHLGYASNGEEMLWHSPPVLPFLGFDIGI